jgi:hypothetical protein
MGFSAMAIFLSHLEVGHLMQIGYEKSLGFQIAVYCNAVNTMEITVVSINTFPGFGYGELNPVTLP